MKKSFVTDEEDILCLCTSDKINYQISSFITRVLVPELVPGDVVLKGLLPIWTSSFFHIVSLPFLGPVGQQDDLYKWVRKIGGVF